jgi:hypothetical protein
MATTLSRRDRALLDFERDWASHEGGKQRAIEQRFGVSAQRYYQLLARLVDVPAAATYDPLTVRRLRRRREERQRRLTAELLGERPGR